MGRWSGCCLGLWLAVSPVLAGAADGKAVLDQWDAAYLKGPKGEPVKTGYVHTRVEELDRDGRQVYRSVMELDLQLKRFRDPIQLRMETGTEETPEGKVTGVFMRQYLGKQQQLHMSGAVQGKQVHLEVAGKKWTAPWNDQVLGLYRQQRLFQDRKIKPGDTFTIQTFEPSISLVVTVRVRIKDFETVALPSRAARQRLLAVEMRPGKVEDTQLPTLYLWLNDKGEPALSRTEMPGLGDLLLCRTTREGAQQGGGARIDLGVSQMVPLNRRIPRPREVRKVVYRLTIKGDEEPASALAQDARQVIKNIKDDTFDLHVLASPVAATRKEDNSKKVGAEFMKSSYFINCDDSRVKALARRAVDQETDAWRKALRIEKWVHDHMTFRNDEALATADHVARTLEGDCTEHAMLAAAMCRAVGVPSRTAQGLIYVDAQGGPQMGFHMWTEVWVRGGWVPIDAVVGRGFVAADHIKVSAHSWYNLSDSRPLLPFLRVVGKVSIKVVSAQWQTDQK